MHVAGHLTSRGTRVCTSCRCPIPAARALSWTVAHTSVSVSGSCATPGDIQSVLYGADLGNEAGDLRVEVRDLLLKHRVLHHVLESFPVHVST